MAKMQHAYVMNSKCRAKRPLKATLGVSRPAGVFFIRKEECVYLKADQCVYKEDGYETHRDFV